MRGVPKVQYFNDCTGGLNNKSARQSLAINETPDCQDVVFGARGGFSTRPGVAYSGSLGFNTTPSGSTFGIYVSGQAVNTSGTEYLFGLTSYGQIWLFDGATVTRYTGGSTLADANYKVTHAIWNNYIYFANWFDSTSSVLQQVKYQIGGTFTVLTNTANNNYTAPTGGNAPKARHVANHSGHMWWADTVEGGTRYASRVRFSHPLQPEDFADADYFDIAPEGDMNPITAIVPFHDMLLVFKRKGVWAIYGYDRDTFVVEQISPVAGVSCRRAIDANSGICYWWSNDGNVFAFNGKGIVPVGTRISNVVNEKPVIVGCTNTEVVWTDSQLLVSLRKPDDTRICFMYDPAVGQNGAWTQYSLEPVSMVYWRSTDPDFRGLYLMLGDGTGGIYSSLYNMIDPDVALDEFANGVFTSIPAFYKTAWFVGGDSATSKKWRRPRITMASIGTGTLNVGVYYDFNESSAHKTMVLPVTIEASGGDMLWDDGTGSVGSDWGSASWAGDMDDPSFEFLKGGSIGRSHAMLLRFEMPAHLYRWWVDSFSVPYVEKSYR